LSGPINEWLKQRTLFHQPNETFVHSEQLWLLSDWAIVGGHFLYNQNEVCSVLAN